MLQELAFATFENYDLIQRILIYENYLKVVVWCSFLFKTKIAKLELQFTKYFFEIHHHFFFRLG